MIDNFTTTPVAVLPPIGKTRKGRTPLTPEQVAKALSVPADYLAVVVGLIDGDGSISVHKGVNNGLTIRLTIELEAADIPMLNDIKETLGIGSTFSRRNLGSLRFGMGELQSVLFPLMAIHGLMFLTDQRRAQFDRAYFVMANNITKYDKLPPIAPVVNELPSDAIGYYELPYFLDWFVGFTVAEGSFYTSTKPKLAQGFSINQRVETTHRTLFEAIKLALWTDKPISVSSKGIVLLNMASIADVQLVIDFFSGKNHHPLIGLKLEKYISWLNRIKLVPRYASIDLPEEVGPRPEGVATLPKLVYIYDLDRSTLLYVFDTITEAIAALSRTSKSTAMYNSLRKGKKFKNVFPSNTPLANTTTKLLSLEELRNYTSS